MATGIAGFEDYQALYVINHEFFFPEKIEK